MHEAMQELQESLGWFVDQNDYLVLTLDAADNDLPIAFKLLDAVENSRDGDLFLSFSHCASEPQAYVDSLMANVRIQLKGVQALRESEGLPRWPDPPVACDDPRLPPAKRIIALLGWVREQLPNCDGHIVLALMPTKIEQPAAYLSVLDGLLPWRGIQPWMDRIRIIVRDDRKHRFLIPQLAKRQVEDVLVIDDIDFSADRFAEAIEAQARDPDLDEEQRANAMMQLACVDLAHGRLDRAYSKWVAMAAFYHGAGSPTLAAHCLCGVGDVLARVGKTEEAKASYQQGLGLAVSEDGIAVALPLLIGAGRTCSELGQWEEAEGYLALADTLSHETVQMAHHAEVADMHGIALLALRETDKAAKQFRVAVDVAKELHHYVCAESALQHLIALFRNADMTLEVREHEQELERLLLEKKRFLNDPASCS